MAFLFTNKLPRQSICLNIPKTGTVFTRDFFWVADCLELRRLCGLNYYYPAAAGNAVSKTTRTQAPVRPSPLSMPPPSIKTKISKKIATEIYRLTKQRLFPYGSLNFEWHPHAPYRDIPHRWKKYPKICCLREVTSWYISYYLYCGKSPPSGPPSLPLLVRLLIHNDRKIKLSKYQARALDGYEKEFISKFKNESTDTLENISLELFFWYVETIRTKYLLLSRFNLDTLPKKIGFLTFRAIMILFNDPKKVFSMNKKEFDEYFESDRYRQDVKCDFFLDFNHLTEQLSSLMINELNYNREIILSLKERFPRQNISPASEKKKAKAMRELMDGDISEKILRHEEIYLKYILPLRNR